MEGSNSKQCQTLIEHACTNGRQFHATAVACEDVADLSITIISADVRPAAADDEFPRWGNFTRLNAFQGKQCGVFK